MKVKHFSSKSNLTELDPSFMGSGVAGAQYKRGVPEHKSSFFYTHDSTPEDVVARQSPHEYEADLSNYKIYNLDDDKEGLVSEMKRRNQNAWNEDILHGIAKERGYHGLLWSQSPETRVVQTYGKTPVTLKKGVARRLTGKLEPKNIPGKEETAEWQTSIGNLQDSDHSYDEETHQRARNKIPKMEGGARFRAMNKLAGKTLSRRHPETGERQFLLFRGAGGDEISASKMSRHISHNQHSSWTPHKHIADGFSKEYDEQGGGSGTLASWINESDIHSVPMMHGELPDASDGDQSVDWTLAGNPVKNNNFSHEHEIVVSPHTSMRATKGDVAAHHARFGKISSVSPVKNINDRINLRAKKDIHDRQDKYPRAKYFPRPTPKKLAASEGEQSEQAKKLWAQKNRPFGKNENRPRVVVSPSIFQEDLEKTEPKSPGEIHPNGDRVAKHHPNGVLMWHSNDGIAKNHDQTIANPELIQNFMNKVPDSHRNLMTGIISSVAKDPNRHFIPTQENGKQKLRARHIKALILGNEDITMDTSKPGVISITRKSHSGGKNAGSQISWNFRHSLGKSEENDGRGDRSSGGEVWDGAGSERGLYKRAGGLHPESDSCLVRKPGRGDLEKGAKQRLFPFNPKTDLDSHDKRMVDNWVSGTSDSRTRLPEPNPNSHKRSLMSLSSKTKARRNPESGEVEFLLHRGVGATEKDSIQNDGHSGSLSSWTPHHQIASAFAKQYGREDGASTIKRQRFKEQYGRDWDLSQPHVVSAWIPQSQIHSIPKYGLGGKPGSVARDEFEVIVKPHRFNLHKSEKTYLKKGEDRYFEDLEKANILRDSLIAGALSAGLAVGDTVKTPNKSTTSRPTVQEQAPITKRPGFDNNPPQKKDHFKQEMLRAIAQTESSGGINTNHEKLPDSGIHGGTKAFGHYGITPVLAKETLRLNPELAQKYPEIANADLHDVNFHMARYENAQHDIAKAHLKRLRGHFGDNPEAISYAWLNGVSGAKKALSEGRDISNHWHVQKVLNALNGTKKSEDSGDLKKMSRPRITFPNIPKTSTRPDQEVQLIENKQQKDLYGRKVAQARYPDKVGRRISPDGSVDENAKISFQARRDEEARQSSNQFGTSVFGVSTRTPDNSAEPLSGALAGSLRSRFEEGDDDYKAKLDQHKELRNSIIRDYNDKYQTWYKKAYELSNKIKDPGGKEAYFAHIETKPEKPKLPRKPSKTRVKTADLSPERMASRGRSVDSTIEHEGLHHILAQIRRHHGEAARTKAAEGLLGNFDKEAVSAVRDFVKKNGYKEIIGKGKNAKINSTFIEEVLAHSRDLLVNPAKRKRFERLYGKQKADATIKSLKRGHQKAYEWAKNVKPEDLGSTHQAPKKLAASELSPAHRAMMKSLLQKDRGSIKFKNMPKVTTRPDMQIQNINTPRQAEMFSRHAAQTLHDSPTNRAASKDALDSHFSEKIDMNNDSNVSSDQRYFRELFDKDIPKETLAQTGAVVSNSRQPQRQKGYVFNETGVGGGSVRQHEGIHYLFNSLGPEGSQKAYTKANSLIHPDVRSAMSKYLTNVGYSENGHFKEMVPHLSQIMIDKHFRDMFEAAGETHLDRDFMTKAKQSWQNIRNWAAKVKPEDLK